MVRAAVADVKFVPNVPVWQKEFRSWEGMVGTYIRGETIKTAAAARLEAPAPGRAPRNRTKINYATGRLSLVGITFGFGKWGRELEGRVVAIPKYAIYVHNGTIPHIIKPRRHEYLKFTWKKMGKVVYSKGVKHPGTEANPFLVRALKKVAKV